jgi:cell division protein FtsB
MKFHNNMITKSKTKKKTGEVVESRLASWSVRFIVLVIAGILLFSNLQMNQRRRQLMLKIDELNQEISAAEKRNKELEAGIAQTVDEGYLEKEARDEFQMKKPGESVVVVSPPENSQDNLSEKSKTWWQKILEKLGL